MRATCKNSANLEQETKTTKIVTYPLLSLASSITELKDTIAGKFDQLEEILTQPNIWAQDTEEHDDASEANGDIDNSGGTTDEPPSKKSKLSSSSEVASKQTVLNSSAEKMQMQEKVDPGINPFTPKSDLIDFTLSDANRFYSV